VLFTRSPNTRIWTEPLDGEPALAEDRLKGLPPALSNPSGLFLLESLYPGLVIPNGRHLGSKHYGREQGKQQTLKEEEKDEDDSGRRGEVCAHLPVTVDAIDDVMDTKE